MPDAITALHVITGYPGVLNFEEPNAQVDIVIQQPLN
jgi:hypothetical protein